MIDLPPQIPITPEEDAALKALAQELEQLQPAHERYLAVGRDVNRIIGGVYRKRNEARFDRYREQLAEASP